MCVCAILAMSFAQSSQYNLLPHFCTTLAMIAFSISPTAKSISFCFAAASTSPIAVPPFARLAAPRFLTAAALLSTGLACLTGKVLVIAITSIFAVSCPAKSSLLIIASKRSSCDRSACNTSQTTLYVLLSFNATSGETPEGMTTGRIT